MHPAKDDEGSTSHAPCDRAAQWDDFAAEYEKRVEPFTSQFAEMMIRPFLDEPAVSKCSGSDKEAKRAKHCIAVLDLGCGSGAASLIVMSHNKHFGNVVATDASKSMVERTQQRMTERYGTEAPFSALTIDGQCLPNKWTNRFDIVLSNFAVIFFPDPLQGMREMLRCLTPSSGVAAFTAWGNVDETPAFRVFPDVASELVPHLVATGKPKRITGSVAVLRSLMEQAGFVDVKVVGPITKTLEVNSAEDYYDRFALTSPPTAAMIGKMNVDTRKKFKDRVMELAKERGGRRNGSIALKSSAYIAYGRRPRCSMYMPEY